MLMLNPPNSSHTRLQEEVAAYKREVGGWVVSVCGVCARGPGIGRRCSCSWSCLWFGNRGRAAVLMHVSTGTIPQCRTFFHCDTSHITLATGQRHC